MACSSATKTTALLLAFIVIFNLATCSSNNNNNNNNNNKKNKNIPRFVINPLTAQTTPATVASTTPTTRATAAKRQTNARMSSQVRDKTKKQEVQSGPSASALLSSATDFEEIAEMDPCFDHDSGEAVRCQPEFSDVAFNVSLRVTSQCGSPSPTVHCLSEIADDEYYNSSKQPIPFNFNGSRQQITTQIAASTPSLPPSLSSPPSSLQTTDSTTSKKRCFTCSRDHPDTSYPSSHLTDLHNPLDPTCWVSTPRVKTVNLTLNLGKRHELTYVTVEFCTGSRQPDAAIFWKSVDHGQSWIPIKYFSTDCQALLINPGAFLVSPAFMRHHHRRDGRHRYHHGRTHRYRGGKMSKAKIPKSTTIATATEANITSMAIGFQPTCSGIFEIKGQPLKLAFRASEGHNEAESLDPDVNLSLREWITFSDLRLTLYHGQQKSGSDLSRSNAGHEFFAVSNFNVGARCKCNGHASQCIPTDVVDDNDDHDEDEDGSRSDDDDRKTGIDHVTKKYEKLKCTCRHNTMGSECEQCKPLYNDRPWTRATSKEAQECTECNCHGHARSCRFNEQLYKASKEYKSGGVCVRCRHNTAGRFCHLCTDGYFRTPGKSMTDKKACSPCSCHPIGSSSGMCNRTTGQCPCKRGVGGRTCDRCTEGFQQGNSPVKPCVQLRKSPGTVSDKSNLCRVYCKRSWSLTNDFAKQVCRENYIVMQMKVISKKFKVLYNNRKPLKSRTWIRYGVEILNVFRKKTNLQSQELNPKQPGAARRFKQYKKDKPKKLSRNSHGGAQLVLPGSKMAAWTRVEDAKDCSCINLKTGFVYLVALPVSRQSRSWQEASTRRQQTTHKIRISMPKFRIAGHRDDSDSFENDVRRNSRQQMVIKWNPQSNEKTSKQDKNISKYANDTIRNASFKTRSKREGRSTTQKPNQNSQNKPTLKVISTPKIALARPIEEIFPKRKQGVLKGKANGFSPFYDLPKKTKEKKSKMERKNVRMSRRSRMRLASDSLVLAWNTKETRDLFNKLDCF